MKRRFLFDHGVNVSGGASVRTVKTGELSIRGTFDLSTLNEEERTVDVCFGTDTPVLMGYWERYYEILSFDGDDCDMSRLNSGAAMLDNHNRWGGTADQPGVVERGWSKGGKGYATLRFARDKSTVAGVADGPGEKIFQRVKDKIVRNVSVGYTVQEYTEIEAAGTQTAGIASENKIPTYRAIKWQPFEISFVSIPADINAGVRSVGSGERQQEPQSYNVPIIFLNSQNQNTDEMKRTFLFNSGTGAEGSGGGGGGERSGGGNGAAPTAPAKPAEPEGAGQRTAEPDANTVALNRSNEIMDVCEIAGLDLSAARAFTSGTLTVEQVRAQIIKDKKERQAPTQNGQNRSITVGDENRKAKRAAVESALLNRAAPHLFPKLDEGAREFRGLDLMDLAREFAEEAHNGGTRGKSKREIAEMALNCGSGRSGMLTSSDLPNVFGNVINRVMLAAYESQPSEWRLFSRRNDFKDFRQKTLVRKSEGQDLKLVKEGGEYERMSYSDGKETIQAFKYGRIVAVTWETLIDDDLNAFGQVPTDIAEMGSRLQADLIYTGDAGLLTNPIMGDTVRLFHATHANLLTGAAINTDSMGLMRKAFRQQKGMAGKQRLNLYPKFMLVGPNYEQLALQYTSSNFVPTAQSGENPWKGSYQVIVESRIEDNSWYGIADPSRIETMQYGFLEGESELFTTQREGFEVDGVEIKARMVFGCKPVDFRAFAKNPGA